MEGSEGLERGRDGRGEHYDHALYYIISHQITSRHILSSDALTDLSVELEDE
jgi:hypothetical protein